MKLFTTTAILGAFPFAISAISLDKQSLPSELEPYAGAQNKSYTIAKMLLKDPEEPLDVGKTLGRAFSRLADGNEITEESLLRKYKKILKKMKLRDNPTFTDEFLESAAKESIAQVANGGDKINIADFTTFFEARVTQPVPVYPDLCSRVRQELAPCLSGVEMPVIKRAKDRSEDLLGLCDRGLTALTSYNKEKCVLIESGLATQGANNQTCPAAFKCYLTGKERNMVENDVVVGAKSFDLSPKEFGMSMMWWQILLSGHIKQNDRLRWITVWLTIGSIFVPPATIASWVSFFLWVGQITDSREEFFELMSSFNEYSE